MHDYPKNRAAIVCACCYSPKPQGLLTCWTCFHHYGLRYGVPAKVKDWLCEAEAMRQFIVRIYSDDGDSFIREIIIPATSLDHAGEIAKQDYCFAGEYPGTIKHY